MGCCRNLGIAEREADDGAFIADMLRILMDEKLDFTLFFRDLTRGGEGSVAAKALWEKRLAGQAADFEMMRCANPIYIARNHQVEAALREAESGEMTRFETLVELLKTPFVERENMAGFEAAPLEEEVVGQTFCGT